MASRPKGFGMTAELQQKNDAKYAMEREREVVQWMGKVTGETLSVNGPNDLQAALMDGIYLCMLINIIKPGSVTKINESKMAFKQMENIGNFLNACENIGIKKQDLFQVVDLYEGQNMAAVVDGLYALGRKAQTIGYNGPVLGPAEATDNHRHFTNEQMKAGETVIGLGMGSNRGGYQPPGRMFGGDRQIHA